MYKKIYHSKDISKSKFLITGGAGFIGSNIVNYLMEHKAGYVRVLDNLSNGYSSNISHHIGLSNFEFIEGDNFHSTDNIKKMKTNISLNDIDREKWLMSINNELKNNLDKDIVIACSVLKEDYRKKIISDINANIFWFCLKGEFKLIQERLKNRKNHFFQSDLLQSQFDIIEYPDYCNFINITESPQDIVKFIKHKILK